MTFSADTLKSPHHDRDEAVTDDKEFPSRSHDIVGEVGWEEVADFCLDGALPQAEVAPKV